jgi:hypothetical protein
VKNLSGGELQRVCHRLISGASFGIFLTSTGGHCPCPRHAGRYLPHRRAFRL